MFHKAKSEKERQAIFDEYMLNILKQKKVIKQNQKIIDEGKFEFNPINEDKAKGAFNSYVDTLVIKNYLVEQIYTRLKINKNMALNFVNKLDSNQILILSKTINDFIKYIQENYFSINDYILNASFSELQKNYNVIQLQEKNKEIIRENQIEQGEILQENIPSTELEEPKEAEETNTEEDLMVEFLDKKLFRVEGVQGFGTSAIKKAVLGEFLTGNATSFDRLSNKQINEKFIKEIIPIISEEKEVSKKERRLDIEQALTDIVLKSKSIPDQVKDKKKNKDLFKSVSGFMKGKGDYGKTDEYINIGKYKAHKNKLMGGKLQIRSDNNNQVHNIKSQVITKNIRDILLKLNQGQTINFIDVDKLNTEEKNQLYMIGKKLHISQLFDIPSTLKTQEEKLKDEFYKLRGSLIAGNNNEELLKKFKVILVQMKSKKLISLQEFNEILNILLEMDV